MHGVNNPPEETSSRAGFLFDSITSLKCSIRHLHVLQIEDTIQCSSLRGHFRPNQLLKKGNKSTSQIKVRDLGDKKTHQIWNKNLDVLW